MLWWRVGNSRNRRTRLEGQYWTSRVEIGNSRTLHGVERAIVQHGGGCTASWWRVSTARLSRQGWKGDGRRDG